MQLFTSNVVERAGVYVFLFYTCHPMDPRVWTGRTLIYAKCTTGSVGGEQARGVVRLPRGSSGFTGKQVHEQQNMDKANTKQEHLKTMAASPKQETTL